MTGGLELAIACDLLVASDRSVFADTHLRVGVFPGRGLVDLPRRVGLAWAKQLTMAGDFIDAAAALRIGLVNEVVPHDALLPRVLELAGSMAEAGRERLAELKQRWEETADIPVRTAHRLHRERSESMTDRGVDATDVVARRDAVMARSRRQRGLVRSDTAE